MVKNVSHVTVKQTLNVNVSLESIHTDFLLFSNCFIYFVKQLIFFQKKKNAFRAKKSFLKAMGTDFPVFTKNLFMGLFDFGMI